MADRRTSRPAGSFANPPTLIRYLRSMKVVPIYIQKLEVENVKTFESCTTLQLTRPEGDIPQWTLLLGDNGIGKSTLLQLIAWMKPVLPYDADDVPEDFVPAPMINDEENEVLERLVHKTTKRHQTATIRAVFVAKQRLGKGLRPPLITCETKMTIALNSVGKLDKVHPEFDTEPSFDKEQENLFYRDEVALYAYSASRQLGKLNLNNQKLADTIPGFIQEKTELYDAEEILHTLNYAALGAKTDKEKEKYSSFTERVKAMLVSLLPDCQDIADIDITPPNPLGGDTEGGITISTKHGKKIPFGDFSLGYKTVTSWTIDLAWRLFSKHHHRSSNPLEEPAIVLVDEIDLHLHPLWQREIMGNLARHFPNVQFIASAHSPLMVQAAIHSNYAVLKFSEEEGVRIENEPEGLDGWRVDQILTGLFGLASARGIKYEELQARRKELLLKSELTTEEKRELDTVTHQLTNLPTGETPNEMKDRQLIADVVQKMKDNKIKLNL